MVQAIFTQGIDVVTAHGLTQWDYGQTLEIHGLNDLPATFQVHFACKRIDEAIVRLATTTNGVGSVVIPDKMLEQDTDIRAWIYIVGTGTGETIKLIQLPIQTRTKPQDFISVVTPSQQTMLEEFMADINESLETSNVTVTQHIANKSNPHEVTLEQVVGESAVPVANGGTGATDAETARTNLEITPSNIGAEPKITKLPISKGGTGAGTAEDARTNLEITPSNIGAEPAIETLPVTKGGTGATDAAGARENLGAASSDHNHSINDLNGTLSVAKGGTGGTTPDEACAGIGALRIVNYSNSYSAGCGDASMWFTYLQNGVNKCQIDLSQNGKLRVNNKDVITTDGGTVTGSMTFADNLWVSNSNSASGYVKIWEDNEGGNIEIGSPNGKSFQMDAYNDTNLRIFSQQSGSVKGIIFNGSNGNFYADGDIYSNSNKKVSTADIQVGVASNVGTSGTTLTFPRAFAGVPVVTANGSEQTSIRVYNITATGCTLVSGTSGNTVQWQAIYTP